MFQKLYSALIQPRSTDLSVKSRELVLNYLLLGAIALSLAEVLTTVFGFIFFDFHYLLVRLGLMMLVASTFVGLYCLARIWRYQQLAAALFAIIFFVLSCLVVVSWGVLLPAGLLLFGLVIVMTGVLLGARYSLYAALLSIVALGTIQQLITYGFIKPNVSWASNSSSQRDVIGFAIIYILIAFVSWLFNRQMEQSLRRAQRSEAALTRQKALLEVKVEERTQQLEAAQLEKMQQIYRFAELGRVSSALFHDLANHLTSVSLEIEGLDPQSRSKIMRRIQRDIHYIDDVVQRVRFQLRGQSEIERFNIGKEISQVIKILSYQTERSKVIIQIERLSGKPIFYTGDVTRFRQLVNNLLTNAIDAYPAPSSASKKPRYVHVQIEQSAESIILRVRDQGIGIKKAQQAKVFEPFYTEKSDGSGIGLFVVKQIVEQDLKGGITLTSSLRHGTEFTVTLPNRP